MNRTKLLKHLVILMFFIFLVNILAIKLYWYFTIWYFDIIMHVLGGVWVGMFFLYVFNRKTMLSIDSKLVIRILLAALFIGILWEIYEFYIYQYISQIPFDKYDTFLDIFFDLAGAFISYFYFSKFIMLDRVNKVQ